jgi:hypothetical protein
MLGMKIVFILFLAADSVLICAQTAQAPQIKRIFVEDGVRIVSIPNQCDSSWHCYTLADFGRRNLSIDLTKEITERCSTVLEISDSYASADYDLRIFPASSTLRKRSYSPRADIWADVYVSSARFKASNLAKHVCKYVAGHP